ncbi:hypothetical protein [Almyronema epifaneia]|uniref:hypothetical protein n=1 Tax=Almyronema epifaneia TaxID=3114805 RepID=UPI003672DDCC
MGLQSNNPWQLESGASPAQRPVPLKDFGKKAIAVKVDSLKKADLQTPVNESWL